MFKTFDTVWELDSGEELVFTLTENLEYDAQVIVSSIDDPSDAFGFLLNSDFGVDSFRLAVGSGSGLYNIRFFGNLPSFKNYDKTQLIDVTQWGDIEWSTTESMFEGWDGSSFSATDAPNLSNTTSMRRMFFGASNFSKDLNDWDVSNVTNMVGVFNGATSFSGDLSSWNVGNVTNMQGMFAGAESFNSNISGWPVSNVESTRLMFNSAISFNQNISGWDIGNVTNMEGMFKNADAFDQPINSWDISNVANLSRMFQDNDGFDQTLDSWKFHPDVDLTNIFDQATGFSCQNYSDILFGWNYRNLSIIDQNLGPSPTLEYDGAVDILVLPLLEDRGWTVPGAIGDPTATCISENIMYWTGFINIDWNLPSNWSNIRVPGAGDIVIIPFTNNQPILDVSTPAIKSIEILDGAVLTIDANGNLNLEE